MIGHQGDIVFRKVTTLPKQAKKKRDNIIAEGEKTGHAHQLKGADLHEVLGGPLYAVVNSEGRVVHEEHSEVKLPKGIYEIMVQREFTAGEVRQVID